MAIGLVIYDSNMTKTYDSSVKTSEFWGTHVCNANTTSVKTFQLPKAVPEGYGFWYVAIKRLKDGYGTYGVPAYPRVSVREDKITVEYYFGASDNDEVTIAYGVYVL